MTYAEAANLAVNQTLVRSINTSIVALIPVGAILYVGVFQLGSGSLKDLALALFVGMAVGAYSSIFIATPLLVHLKGREKGVQEIERRALAKRRHDADRYASVPSYRDDLPVRDSDDDQDIEDDDSLAPAGADRSAPPRPPGASRGRRPRPRGAAGPRAGQAVRARPAASSPPGRAGPSAGRSEQPRDGPGSPGPSRHRRPGLPRAGDRLQGHHPAARRRRRVRRRRGRARRRRP